MYERRLLELELCESKLKRESIDLKDKLEDS